ncbi:MAG: hypothetical protein Q9188_005177 [Gyalolechia gomerana]
MFSLMPMVYCLYSEFNQRTLEKMHLLFAADAIWVWHAERNYKLLIEQTPELVQTAQRGKGIGNAEGGVDKSVGHVNLDSDAAKTKVLKDLGAFSTYALLLLPVLFYILPFLRNRSIRNVPGPFVARFSNLWLLYQARRGRRYQAVDAAHKKYGTLVRIQPDHVSVADSEAIPIIYSHTSGWTKSEYYDAFVSIRRGLFNTRDRAEHSRKRKAVSHTFSAKSISQFEPFIEANLQELVKQWNRLSDRATGAGKDFAEMDCLHWFNYTAFDIIGDLAFGAPFGMVSKGQDIAEVRSTPDSLPSYAPAIQVLNRRGEVSNTLGCYPALKPFAKYLPDPFFRNGLKAVEDLAGIAVARVNQRLAAQENGEPQRNDLLARLMEGKDEDGNKLGREELTAEALTQLIAGSDTTSNTSCALLYWCTKTPGVMDRLRKEIDEAVPNDVVVPSFDSIKDLP